MGKTIRFGDLVRASGRPQVRTLWTKPSKDTTFMNAVKGNRVLTVYREPGKRDFGHVGFQQRPGALCLIFPRPLIDDRQRKVVGINYELMEQPDEAPEAPQPPAANRDSRKVSKPKETKRMQTSRELKPATKEFKVKVRRVASMTLELRVSARDKQAARKQAIEMSKQQPFVPTEEKDQIVALE